jgi:cytidine deaminase
MVVAVQVEMVHLELQLMAEQSAITQLLHQVRLETERQILAAAEREQLMAMVVPVVLV